MTAKQAKQMKHTATLALAPKLLPKVNAAIRAAAKTGDDKCSVSFKPEVSIGLVKSIQNVLLNSGFEVIADCSIHHKILNIYWQK